jgi:hypothetical protein
MLMPGSRSSCVSSLVSSLVSSSGSVSSASVSGENGSSGAACTAAVGKAARGGGAMDGGTSMGCGASSLKDVRFGPGGRVNVDSPSPKFGKGRDSGSSPPGFWRRRRRSTNVS